MKLANDELVLAKQWCADSMIKYVAAGFKSTKTSKDLDDETQTILAQCLMDYPVLEAALASPLPESKTFELVDVLKSANLELKKLVGSKAPEKQYTKDFALSKKAQLAAAECSEAINIRAQ